MRKGYNTDWQWKRWAAEVRAAKEAIEAHRFEEAELHINQAVMLNSQMLLWERESAEDDPGQDSPHG
jgi:hypothetical protein